MEATLSVTSPSVYSRVILLLSLTSLHAYVTRIDQCEPIEIPRCRSMPYNMTQMPNLMHHNTQENARLVFERFEILIDQHCSDVLLFFLCSIYVPICAVSLQPEAIPPCRSVCEKARAGCEPLMNIYKVPWPDSLECSKLPRYERGVCVSPEAFVKPTKSTDCVCKGRKPSYRIVKKYNYDYAIRAIILKKKNISDKEMIYKVKRWQEQINLQSFNGKSRQTGKRRKKGKGRQPQKTKNNKNETVVITPNPPSRAVQGIKTDDLAHGYTHGGRYYTKDFPPKFKIPDLQKNR